MTLSFLLHPIEKVLQVLASLVIRLLTLPIKEPEMIDLFMTSHRELHVHGG